MKKIFIIIILLFHVILLSFSQSYEKIKGGLLPERACFDVGYYDLHLTINPDKQTIKGHNTITFKIVNPINKIQLDLFSNLRIDSIVFEGKKLKYNRKFDAFFVEFPTLLEKGKNYTVSVYYGGTPQVGVGVRKTDGFHWRKHKEIDLIGVSCQIAGASLWYPCKEYLGDEPDSVRLHWTVPIELQCISNGKLEKTEISPIAGYKTSHWVVRNPINSYNITIYLGNYERKIGIYAKDTIKYEIEYYFLKNNTTIDKQKEHVRLGLTFVKFCEQTFGEYAFWNDKMAVVETVYDGMEHQSCVAVGPLSYNPGYPYRELGIHGTLIHELAHEWWGNAVSSSDMGDMWLHEGFATFTEYLFIEKMYGKEMYERQIQKILGNTRPILAKRNVYSSWVFGMDGGIYWEGASFLYKLRKEIKNDPIFFDILRTFYERYKKKTVLTENFLQIVNEKTNKDWTQFFKNGLE
jgi:aminopeptidase N